MRERGVSFQEIADIILRREYLDILENPSHPDQDIFIVHFNDYTWLVPFMIDNDVINLITVFPSRKFHKRYGGQDEIRT
jgi:hypothetical protein